MDFYARLKYYIGDHTSITIKVPEEYYVFKQNEVCYYRGPNVPIQNFNFNFGKLTPGWWWGENGGYKVDMPCLAISADGTDNRGLPVLCKARKIDKNKLVTYDTEDADVSKNQPNGILVKFGFVRHWKILDTFNDKYEWKQKIDDIIWRGNHIVGLNKVINRRYILEKYSSKYNFRFIISDKLIDDIYYINNKHLFSDIMTIDDMCAYKYLLCIEGNDVATALKWMMKSNSVVLMARPTVESWLMEGLLEPYVHYVPINDDFDNIGEMLDWCRNNEDKCLEIVKNANKWMEQFSNYDEELKLHKTIVEWYAKNITLI